MEWSWQPVQLSFFVGIIATIIALGIVFVMMYLLHGRNFKGKSVIETVLFLPLVLPPTVIGFLLIILFGYNGPLGRVIDWLTGRSILFTVCAAVIAASVVAFPLMYQSVKTGFLLIDEDVIRAAKVDGANKPNLFMKILIPLSQQSVITAIILGFLRAFGEFGATLMFAGNIPGRTQTIPTAIYLAIETGNRQVAAYYVLISVGVSFFVLWMINRKSK